MKICILGEGAWGTAIATLLVRNGHIVHLWCVHPEIAQEIDEKRTNSRYLSNVLLDKRIIPFADMQQAVDDVGWIGEAIPTQYLRSVLQKAQSYVCEDQKWIMLSKGIEHNTLLLPSQILDDVFKRDVAKIVLSGPSFARDIINKQVTAVVLAGTDSESAQQLSIMIGNEYFRPYVSSDIIGAQIGGALKNVIALGIGILDGAGYTDNTKAFFLTQGFAEIVILASALGAQQDTLYGLSGFGDLVLTAMGKHSKNFLIGQLLGQGGTLADILTQHQFVPESINTLQSLHQLIMRHRLDLPICMSVYQVVFHSADIKKIVHVLMQ